jgi:Ca2+-binding RTX toxin-like protein
MPILTGTSENDTLIGGLADSELYGLDGDDRLDGAGGTDCTADVVGNDTLVIYMFPYNKSLILENIIMK